MHTEVLPFLIPICPAISLAASHLFHLISPFANFRFVFLFVIYISLEIWINCFVVTDFHWLLVFQELLLYNASSSPLNQLVPLGSVTMECRLQVPKFQKRVDGISTINGILV